MVAESRAAATAASPQTGSCWTSRPVFEQVPERLAQRSLQPPPRREERSREASGTERERKRFLLPFNWRLLIGRFRSRLDNAVTG